MTSRALTASAPLAAVLVLTACSSPGPDTVPAATSSAAPPPAAAPASPSPPGQTVATPVLGRVLAAPVPVPASDGKVHLAYELQLTNTLDQDVTLTSVDVRAGGETLLSLPADRLAYWTRIIGSPTPTTTLGPAQSAYVWLDVALDPDQAVPEQLSHTVGITVPRPILPLFPGTMTEDIAPVTVQTREPVVISPPLPGPTGSTATAAAT